MLLISSLASRKKPDAVTCPLPPSIVTLPAAAANERGPSLIGGDLAEGGRRSWGGIHRSPSFTNARCGGNKGLR